MIRSLLYLTISRLEIIFSICMYARYQSNPKKSHVITIKRILRYLIDTQNSSLWFLKQSSLDLIDYLDTDFVGYKLNKKYYK